MKLVNYTLRKSPNLGTKYVNLHDSLTGTDRQREIKGQTEEEKTDKHFIIIMHNDKMQMI